MHKLKDYYANLNLQNKLRFSYILLILIPVTFLCVLYYNVASQSILDVAKKNILDVTIKNTEIVDSELKSLQENIVNLNVDNEIYTILDETEDCPDSQLLAMDKRVRIIMQKYFSNDYLIAANIMTPRYTYGDNSHAQIPNYSFYSSEMFKYVKEHPGEVLWFPTYDAEKSFQVGFRIEESKFFSLMYELHPVYIDPENPNDVRYLERENSAVMVLHFDEDIMREMFESSNSVKGAFYCVSSVDGQIVSHTDSGREGKKEKLPWLDEIGKEKSGSMILEYQGEKVVVCYAVSTVTGWISASVTPVYSLLNKVSEIQGVTIVVWVLLFFLAMVLATIFSRRITQPIGRLVEAMKQTGKGNFGLRLPTHGTDEMQYLTEKYNEMGEKIQNLVEENYKSEIRNKESEIMALTLQLNPHFLYNTLNIVNLMAMEEGNMDVSRMILSLSDMLQYTFRNKQELVAFEEEYTWLQNYLHIMQVRFEGKFNVSYRVEKELYQCKIPKLLLQPIIENAIVHGFKKMESGGLLELIGKMDGENIYLEIRDNGRGMSPEELQKAVEQDNNRIGLGNAMRRVQLIYGERGRLEVDTLEGKGTSIRVTFPAQS